jgi:uncharacterized protein
MPPDPIRIARLIAADPERVRLLRVVHDVCGAEFWIGAGFVRNTVWSNLHGRSHDCDELTDIDVVTWRQTELDPARDAALEDRLRHAHPAPWSVTNQARMNVRNGHESYRDLADAIAHWPETATAIACRLRADGGIDILAPHGVDDLLAGILRPTPAYSGRPEVVMERVGAKRWLERWPRLRLCL